MTPADVVAEALTWLGTPYHHAARVKGAGADCGQFPTAVFQACGLVPEFEIEPYNQDWHMHNSEERYLGYVELFFVKVEAPQPADLALFKYGRVISHGSIVVGWPSIIHAYVTAGKVTLDDGAVNADLAPRFKGWWRLKQWTVKSS